MRDVGRERLFDGGRIDHLILSPAWHRDGATVTAKFALVKPIVADRRRGYRAAAMLNDRSSILSLLETRRSAKPRELVGPGPTAERARAHPDDCRAHARPRQAHAVALRDRRRRPARRVRGAAPRGARRATTRARPPRITRRKTSSPIMPGSSSCWSRRRSHDHKIPLWEQELSCGAAGMNLLLARPCARLCRRMGDRLARLFASACARAFCGPGERIAGFIFIGHPGARARGPPRGRRWKTVAKPWQPRLSFG